MKFAVSKELPLHMVESAGMAYTFLEAGLHEVAKVKNYTYTNLSPHEVFNFIEKNKSKYIVEVLPWTPKWVFTSAIATTFSNQPGKVYLNVFRLNSRSKADWSATLIHEAMHVMGFGHGNNYWQHKEPKLSSVPIQVARIAKDWIEKYSKV